VQGGYNMIRKVVPTIFDNQGIEGLELNPVIVNSNYEQKFSDNLKQLQGTSNAK
jgi:hypothetical protein